MKRTLLTLMMVVILPLSAIAQWGPKPIVVELWPNGAPTSNGLAGPEIDRGTHVSNVTNPTLTIYPASNPNGKAIIACPGGGYIDVWTQTEGHQMAEWYNAQGITYAVLKYRLPNGHKEVPLDDVFRAMDIMHERQAELGFTKLGIQGNSAGGHLASTAATHFDCPEHRPDFQILYYPVITFDPKYTHSGSVRYLIGENAPQELIDYYSNEKQVKADTPPAIIIHCTDDSLVPVQNAVNYYLALVEKGISASLHVYPKGNHGFAFGDRFQYKRQWTEEVEKWLRSF